MKFYMQIVGKDLTWGRGNGVRAVLAVEVEGNWLALRPQDADRMDEFTLGDLDEFTLVDDGRRRVFKFCPERKINEEEAA